MDRYTIFCNISSDTSQLSQCHTRIYTPLAVQNNEITMLAIRGTCILKILPPPISFHHDTYSQCLLDHLFDRNPTIWRWEVLNQHRCLFASAIIYTGWNFHDRRILRARYNFSCMLHISLILSHKVLPPQREQMSTLLRRHWKKITLILRKEHNKDGLCKSALGFVGFPSSLCLCDSANFSITSSTEFRVTKRRIRRSFDT